MRQEFDEITSGWTLISGMSDLTERIEQAVEWTKVNGPLQPDEAARIALMIQAQITRKMYPQDVFQDDVEVQSTDTSKTPTWTKGPWRIDEGRSIEAFFEGEWCQVASMNRCHWAAPNQDKNLRFNATRDGDARLISKAPEMADLLNKSLAAFASPDEMDVEGLAGDIRRLLKELEL